MVLSRATTLALTAAAILEGCSAAKSVFDYDPASPTGPAQWANLDIPANACGGQKNSPIAVETPSCGLFANYELNAGTCGVTDLDFSLNDHGVKVSYPADSCSLNTLRIPVAAIDGVYEALQFHVHTSSEHSIDGEHFGAEMHIVHKQTDANRYAVVGMMIEATNTVNHPMFETLLQGWETVAEATLEGCGSGGVAPAGRKLDAARRLQAFNAYDLVPEGSTFYHYDGGLTTPPCSEVVWWNLADTPVSLSPSQYNRLSDLILGYRDPSTCELATVASPSGSTSRPPQPLNGRELTRICPVGFVDESLVTAPAPAATQPVPIEVTVPANDDTNYGLVVAIIAAVLAVVFVSVVAFLALKFFTAQQQMQLHMMDKLVGMDYNHTGGGVKAPPAHSFYGRDKSMGNSVEVSM